MKKVISILLSVLLLAGCCTALAASSGESRVVIGADLTDEQITSVYKTFGIERGSVTELKLTNAEERACLSGAVDESVIGTASISCVYIQLLNAGAGYDVSISNINWCTEEMYRNALITAGLSDVKVMVTAPFAVSGTAALAGIYKAYEDITGKNLDAVAKDVGTQELVITGDLANEIGSYDATEIVNELKLILDETRNMTDDEVKAQIREIATEYSVSLSDSQVDQLLTLCRQLEKLDDSSLLDKVKSLQDTVKKLGELQSKAEETKEKLSGVQETLANVADTIRSYTQPVINFFKNLFSGSGN